MRKKRPDERIVRRSFNARRILMSVGLPEECCQFFMRRTTGGDWAVFVDEARAHMRSLEPEKPVPEKPKPKKVESKGYRALIHSCLMKGMANDEILYVVTHKFGHDKKWKKYIWYYRSELKRLGKLPVEYWAESMRFRK